MDYTQDEPQIAIEVDGQVMSREEFMAKRDTKLEGIRQEFVRLRDKWVQHRNKSGVEERWKKAKALYEGAEEDSKSRGAFEETLKTGPMPRKAGAARSRVVINIVRPKVDQAIARMCEILLPVDDKNWGIRPTPLPSTIQKYIGDMTPTVDEMGQPTGMTSDQEVKLVISETKKKAEGMERHIDDVLNECGYNGEQRSMIADGVKLGTGILLGPFPSVKVEKRWSVQADAAMMAMTQTMTPKSMRADPWDVWFDPACGNEHQRGQGFFHRRFVTRRELRALKGTPGYREGEIQKVLATKPNRLRVAEGRVNRTDCDEDSYELWMYYGDIEPDHFNDLSYNTGMQMPEDAQVTTCMMVMVNDCIVGVAPSWVPDNTLPIDVWNWRRCDESPFGYGLPEECEHQQRVVNSAWRMVMDNGRTSLGGQIVINKKKVVPQNGSYEIEPNKVWLAADDVDDVRGAMAVFEFNSHLQELLLITDSAMKFVDQETNMPQMLGGERGTAPETVGGMVMLQSNALSVPRLRVKQFDDNVTRPHISRYYDFFMATSDDDSIKGDMQVDARGVSVLLERDIQNQAAINLAAVTSNPRYQALIDPKKELEVILPAFKVRAEDLLYTDEEMQKNAKAAAQNPPQDPRIAVAQMQMQAKQMDLEDRKAQREVDLQLAQADLQVKQQNLAYQTERERSESEQAQIERQLERELAIAKMEQDGVMTREELARKERLEMLKLTSDRELFNAEMAVKVRQGSGI